MIYEAHKDHRTAMEQLQDGWLLRYHPKMGSFYTYDPENQAIPLVLADLPSKKPETWSKKAF